jgi:methyltransferase-like protein
MHPELLAGSSPTAIGATATGEGARSVDGYDRLSYPAMPVALSQPQHLAALAILHGLDPPDVTHARVLELGCATAGNIIPLAARFPEAVFLGVDLAQRHIDQGRGRIAELDLRNIGLEQGDLASLELAGRQFDYVICHGVFSWVPREVQEAIFRICRQTLTANGLATISYNVLPGWHLRMVIRDLCRRYAGGGTPQQRVARARAALRQIAEASSAAEPYGQLLRLEARRLQDVPSAYILGEFLAAENRPCHVTDFIARAAEADLDYLCEADLAAAVPPDLEPGLRSRIDNLAGSDRALAEQHVDFLTGRLFRRSVLVRRQSATKPTARPDPALLRRLHVASQIRFDAAQSDDRLSVFTDRQARPISTADPLVSQTLKRLEAAYPDTLTLGELVGGPTDEVRVARAILTILLAGRGSVSVLPVRVGRASDVVPRAWAVARAEAGSIQPWITTLLHGAVPASPILRLLLPLLDGTNDRAAVSACLAEALQTGAVAVPELPPGQPSPPDDRLDGLAERYFTDILDYLERNALLEPAA